MKNKKNRKPTAKPGSGKKFCIPRQKLLTGAAAFLYFFALCTNQAYATDMWTKADTFLLLADAENRYSGVCQKGIKALQMKCLGHTRKEIAACYGVQPNHVSAWISRATSRLRAENCLSLQ